MAFDRAGNGLAASVFASAPARLALIKGAWPFAVGHELARRTEVLALDGRTLRVRVPDAGWRKVLHRMQPQIVERLRAIAGELGPVRLGFSEGQVAAPAEAKPAAGAPAAGPDTLDPAVAAAAERIADAELRRTFLASAARYLARAPGRR
jgi:Dna[CI] antecedent DciA-like protein